MISINWPVFIQRIQAKLPSPVVELLSALGCVLLAVALVAVVTFFVEHHRLGLIAGLAIAAALAYEIWLDENPNGKVVDAAQRIIGIVLWLLLAHWVHLL